MIYKIYKRLCMNSVPRIAPTWSLDQNLSCKFCKSCQVVLDRINTIYKIYKRLGMNSVPRIAPTWSLDQNVIL
jgi:hypothetical protein